MRAYVLNGFFLSLIAWGLGSCGFHTQEADIPMHTAKIINPTISGGYSFNEEQIFDIKQVKEAINDADEILIAKSEDYLKLAGEQLGRGDTYQSIPTFIKSIVAQPSSEAFFGLGNGYLEIGLFEDAIDAYHMAEYLDYQPMSDIYYHLASAYSSDYTDLDGMNRSVKYLKQALESGYDDRHHFMTNNNLREYRYSEEYLDLFLKYFSNKGKTQRNQALFELFVNLFPRKEMPHEITFADLNGNEEDMRLPISHRFYPFINQRGNKYNHASSTTKVFYQTLVLETDAFIALLYEREPTSKKTSPKDLRKRSSYDIATFSKNGKLIDRLKFADCLNPSYFLEGRVNADHTIEINQYKNFWSKDFQVPGDEQRIIEYSHLTKSNTYVINDNGRFVQQERPLLSYSGK